MKKERFIPLIILVIVLLLMFFILKPYFISVLLACVVAFLFYPLYNIIKKVVRNSSIASLITIFIFILLIIIPSVFVITAFVKQATTMYYLATSPEVMSKLPAGCASESSFVCSLYNYVKETISKPETISALKEPLSNAALSLVKAVSNFIFAIPKFILSVFVMLFTLYYLFKQGPEFVKQLIDFIPISEKNKPLMTKKFKSTLHSLVYGNFLVALVQAIVAGIGLWIFGVTNPLLWAGVMFVLALLPFVGAWLVWFPGALYMIFKSLILDTPLWGGVGLLIYGFLVINNVDNLIRPKIMGGKAVHPVIVLLGVFGGIPLFGIFGIIIGPLLLALSVDFIQYYRGS